MRNGTPTTFPIVGIGASAGGIQALEGLFRGMPSDPGVAFVVVTHLNPDRESLLSEIVARYTDLSVVPAADGVEVAPNTIYVMPSDGILTIKDGCLRFEKLDGSRRERRPVDIFLSALAVDQGDAAASIILSGGDSDGTLGTKAIKERGGLTFAQATDGHGPAHPSMPDSAISTGYVDFAIPVDQMGRKIMEFAHGLKMLDALAVASGEDDMERALEDCRKEIYGILRTQVGHDFAGYKTKTFVRRVHRRMQVVQVQTTEAYVEYLRQNPREVTALFRDLLINVTNFFRDADAFDKLKELVIPKLFEHRGADETIRIWVPGCATGEEVFSIAMLMREHMDTLDATPRVQIFATDIDEHALAVARAARYPAALMESVSAERRQRFFLSDGGTYVVNKDVRDLCIFSPHSVIKDPPFSRIDMVSCRNLLIYFGADIQNQVIPIFHYCLRPGGFLFLGTSESVSQFAELFLALEKKYRIFRKRESETPKHALVPLIFSSRFRAAAPGSEILPRQRVESGAALRQVVESQVLDRFAPAHVVVTQDGDVVYFSARTGKYLEPATGSPSRQLLNMARKGLRLDLRTGLREAAEQDRRVVREHLASENDDGRVQFVTVTIEPVAGRDANDRLFLVVFADDGPALGHVDALPNSDKETLHLERELHDTRDRLQSLIEEYETALEELKSSNEELVSVNEEMQSTNEELEASKEELQSLNEELQTVNAELSSKVEALDRANTDLENLFESSQVATVFLDKNLVIRSFTPAVARVFNILPGDRGRPLTDLSSRVPLDTFAADVKKVLASGNPIEERIKAGDDLHFLVRLHPYRDVHRNLDGVVATFIDVTSVTRAEEHQKVLIAELNHRVKNMLSVVLAVADQTLKASPSIDAFRKAFVPRVHALARSYELLSRENWTDASIDEMVRQELAPFDERHVTISGPPVRLKPRQALSLGMILHELATNAGKYGALSCDAGTVTVGWSLGTGKDAGQIVLTWREAGGPRAKTPQKYGFGLTLVQRETEYNLDGKARIAFPSDGIEVIITFDITPE